MFVSTELKEEDIKHNVLVVKINQIYRENMSEEDLYNAVRGIWVVKRENVEQMDYVFGVYQSVIVAVYKPKEWFVCKDMPDQLPRKNLVLNSSTRNRLFFVDDAYDQPDENKEFYIGKSLCGIDKVRKSQNPAIYLWCKK